MSSEEITALQSVATTRKPSRVRKFKEDYVRELTLVRMELHSVKCKLELITIERDDFHKLYSEYHDKINHPSIRFALGMLVKAVKGWCK